MSKGISIVIPVFNEEENVAQLYFETKMMLERMAADGGWSHEIIFVDDGSGDHTVSTLCAAAGADPQLKVIELRRNFGQTAAMAAGLENSRFDVVVTMDGDLQNDPNEIPRMVEKLEAGYDMVAGWRKNRQDAFFSRKLPSKIANWIISKSTRVRLHDYGCSLKAMTGEIARGIKLYGEMHRFIPALADHMGARIAEIPVNHRARKFGKSKYGISRTIRVNLDLITVKFLLGYSKRPIHLFGALGLISMGSGVFFVALTTYDRFFRHIPMGNRPVFFLGVTLGIVGLQFIVFGLLAEVLARTYYESQNKRIYFVRRIISGRGAEGRIPRKTSESAADRQSDQELQEAKPPRSAAG